MKKRLLFLFLGATLLVVSANAANTPQLTSAVPQAVGFVPSTSENLGSVLVSQAGNGATGYVTQNFEAAYDIYDSSIADDFTLAQDSCAKSITVVGFNSGVSALTGNLRIYMDSSSGGGQFHNPGTIVCEYLNVTNTGGGGPYGGDMVLDFAASGGCCLTAGVTYWISVQANMSFGTSGEFYWVSSTPVTGTQFTSKNPGNSFGTGCADYGEHCTQCSGICPEGPRNMGFTLEGDMDCNNCIAGDCDLTAIEAKLDAAEGKLDAAEGKLDALDALEGKADAIESKLDAIEAKLDVTMSGINEANSKLDVLESKYDAGGGGGGDKCCFYRVAKSKGDCGKFAKDSLALFSCPSSGKCSKTKVTSCTRKFPKCTIDVTLQNDKCFMDCDKSKYPLNNGFECK